MVAWKGSSLPWIGTIHYGPSNKPQRYIEWDPLLLGYSFEANP